MPANKTLTETRTFWCAMDNYEHTREWFRGRLEVWKPGDDLDTPTYVILPENPFYRVLTRGPIGFLLDDGETVVACYVTGYQPLDQRIFIEPMPTNPGGRRKRADNGETIDYRSWTLGPRRFYHLKLYD